MCWLATIKEDDPTGIRITHKPDVKFTNNDKWVIYNPGGSGRTRTEPRSGRGYRFCMTKDEAVEWGEIELSLKISQLEQLITNAEAQRKQFRLQYGLEG